MLDQFDRKIEYLRLSLTERCTLRCVYCRKDEGNCPKTAELSAGEFYQIVLACIELGVNRVRLTGGEPLLRKDILEIVNRISSISELKDLSLTTNGQMLANQAADLKKAGLRRINISLDSLDAEKYHQITGGDIHMILAGIDQAIAAELLPVKLNMVVVKGLNDDEIDDFIELTKDRPVDVRMIELMPMTELGFDHSNRINNDDLISARPYLKPMAPYYPGQPSRDFQVSGYQGRVGFISPISHRFCASCNRIRIMSDGTLRSCLGNNHEVSLKPAMGQGHPQLVETIRLAAFHKPAGHNFDQDFVPVKSMAAIGG